MMYQTSVILTLSFYYHHRDMIKQAERAGVRMEARRVETRAKRVVPFTTAELEEPRPQDEQDELSQLNRDNERLIRLPQQTKICASIRHSARVKPLRR